PQRELHGRRAAGGSAEDRRARDPQGVQEMSVRVGLRLRRGVVRQGSAKVAESRHRDDAESPLRERFAEGRGLCNSPARAMDDEDGLAFAGFGVLDRASGRLGDLAARRGAEALTANLAPVAGPRHPEKGGSAENGRWKHAILLFSEHAANLSLEAP